MTALARLLIHCAALLVASSERGRWREEWLAEFDAVAAERRGDAWRFAFGAPVDALSTRAPMKLFSAVANDVRYAARQLMRRPAHTVAVIACLIVGLVASVATFSVISSLLYGDMAGVIGRATLSQIYLSYDRPDREGATVERESARMSFNDFDVFRAVPLGPSLSAVGAEGSFRLTAVGEHGPASLRGAFASADFFTVLRTEPVAGRFFTADDDRADAPRVAVVGADFWRTHLDGRVDAIGRPILVGGLSYTVVGVAPPRFHGLQPEVGEPDSEGVQVWMPIRHLPEFSTRPGLDDRFIGVIGRRRPGVTTADVEHQLSVAAARVGAANPARRAHAAVLTKSFGFGPNDASAEVLALMAAAMSLPLIVLAIGCANVANLQLARVAEQSRELAIRLSLGATRAQLLRLLTAETLARVLVAIAISIGIISLVIRWLQPLFPIIVTLDWRVMTFGATLALGVAVGTGLAPAWLVLRRGGAGQLKQTAQSGGLGHARIRGALVVTQVALSLGLLVLTGLFGRTVQAVAGAAPPALRHQLVATFDPSELKLSKAEASQFAKTVAARVAADSRVRAVSLSSDDSVRYGLVAAPKDLDRSVELIGATASWLDVMDIKVLAGRPLADDDDASAVVLSARAAEQISPNGSAVGMALRMTFGADDDNAAPVERQVRVVGVVADSQTRPTSTRPDPVIYVPFRHELPGGFTLRVRADNPDALRADVMRLINQMDRRVTWTSLRRGDTPFEQDSKEMGYLAYVVGAAGFVALILSATGLYAVMSYVVTLRRREIGVRLAIGAPPSRILSLMLRQSMRLVIIGVGWGLLLAIPLAFWLRSAVVIEVNPADPMVFLPTIFLLTSVGALAATLPALRASRVDPISTLRQD